MIPEIEFQTIKIEKELPILYHFLKKYRRHWDWSEIVYKHYPELKNKIKDIPEGKERRKTAYCFFQNFYENNLKIIEQKTILFQKEWNKVNNRIMKALSEVTECEWNDKEIEAKVSLNPICPRFIKEREFNIFYKQTIENMKDTCTHESLHFLYFDKWKKVFPKMKEKEMNSPYLVWHLSEMVPGIILNDEKIQKNFKHKFRSYREYENLKINNKPILESIQEIYDNREDFEDFLKKSWKFVNKNKKEILNA